MHDSTCFSITHYDKSFQKFKNILTSVSGGIIRLYSRSRSSERNFCEEFLYKAFIELNLPPISVRDITLCARGQSNRPLWIDTYLLLSKKDALSETQWLMATQGTRHIILCGHIDDLLARMSILIAHRTFVWIISSGPALPFRDGQVLLIDEEAIDSLNHGSLDNLWEYMQLISGKRTEDYELHSIKMEMFANTLTPCQCATVVAFFVASNQKDIYGLYGGRNRRSRSKIADPNSRNRTRGDDDGFNARIVNRQVLLEAFRLILGHFFATFISKRDVPYDDYFLRESKGFMALEPSDHDIECLCQSGYISITKSQDQSPSYGYIAMHQSTRSKYRTKIPFNLLHLCCKKLSLDSASYV